MDRIQEMQVFVRIAERRSFTQAADDLQIPRATVTNLMKRMEKRLGARLLERTTRQVRLTHDGDAHYQRCLRLLADIDEVETAFQHTAPTGLLRVNLQGTLAKYYVVPALPDFLARYPDITLHMGEDDRLVDLVREGIDCVLRAGALPDSSMVARPLGMLQQVTVASPAYLDKHGVPTRPDKLAGHHAVNYLSSGSGKAMPLEFMVDGVCKEIWLESVIAVTGTDLYTGSAIAGLGLVQVPRYRIEPDIAAGRLQVVLPEFPPPPMRISVMYPQNRHLSSRVRVFAQWLQEVFRDVG